MAKITELSTIVIEKCGVICQDEATGTYLMVRQRHHDKYFGWPKGHKEKHETLLDCAVREWKEETTPREHHEHDPSLNVISKSKLASCTSFYCINYPSLIYFVTVANKSQLRIDVSDNAEISDFKWFSLDEIIRMTFFTEFKKLTSIFTKHVNCLLLQVLGYQLTGYTPELESFSNKAYSKTFSAFLRQQESLYRNHQRLS